MKISEVALSLYSRNSSRIQVRLFTFHCFHIMAHFRSACQLAWKTKKKRLESDRVITIFQSICSFCFACIVRFPQVSGGGAWSFSCSPPLMNLRHFWDLWWKRTNWKILLQQLNGFPSIVGQNWTRGCIQLQGVSTMECVEGYDNYHKEYSPSKHLKGVAWKLHTAVLFTYCKLECRHIITLAKKEAGGCGLYSCHSD